jgi:hypothetical protein
MNWLITTVLVVAGNDMLAVFRRKNAFTDCVLKCIAAIAADKAIGQLSVG